MNEVTNQMKLSAHNKISPSFYVTLLKPVHHDADPTMSLKNLHRHWTMIGHWYMIVDNVLDLFAQMFN